MKTQYKIQIATVSQTSTQLQKDSKYSQYRYLEIPQEFLLHFYVSSTDVWDEHVKRVSVER